MSASPRINVTDVGSGPEFVFVHGWLNDASVWNGMVEELSDRYRCLAVDLRGHGASDAAGAGNYGRDLVLDDLRQIMADRDIDQAVYVGHSLGGYLSLALAIESPELVTGLGLVAAGPGFRNPDSREQWNESVRQTAAGRDIPEGMEVISMHVDAMVMDRLGEIEVPVAVVVGERDGRFISSAEIFDRYLDVKSREIVAGAGHMVHVKEPAEVARVLSSTFSV